MKNWFGTLLVLLLASTAVACLDGGSSEEEVAAQDYLRAVLNNDADFLSLNTCANVPEGSGSQELLGLWSIGLALKAAGPEYNQDDLDVDVTAQMKESSEDSAEVRMRGTVAIPEDLVPSEQMPLPVENTVSLDEVWRMVKEENVWKWCGGVAE